MDIVMPAFTIRKLSVNISEEMGAKLACCETFIA
jgi:hypothetical protein